ncbi:cellulose biosynthesis cyclic di-GMP-binding regulatory protein BcsB [Thermosyntropha sp.]|uniref:cellulose biosynthesis cyclic di-GMP-binding regulatory protein BcsB n=1 Tax=Thermosyntropha sp. TaxID=2740820 RepID=UPI0025CB7FA0|nr:cellulose biosynthesis cyclic di-GMP-binding regulatory protein BcsB [Thermosyntropha sp.]MBO8159577.1 cellulose biosynthesis cyclic di-GMP-binding regulatory protein BcsB [Thermosyntropha sp.]
MRRLMAFIIIVLFLGLLFLPYGVRAEELADNSTVYNIKMFAEDIVLNAPINEYYYWLELKPGFSVKEASIILSYSCSETIIKELSSLTVSINGKPIASTHIEKIGKYPSSLKVKVPANMLVKGINEIKITTTQRSIEKTCQDVDNKANWVVLHNNSVIHLDVLNEPASLNDYPYPFLNNLSLSPVNAVWYLPSNPGKGDIEAMFEMAADWGADLRGGNLENLKIITDKAAGLQNQIFISSALNSDRIKKGYGYISLVSEGNNLYRLIIGGNDEEGLHKAISFVSSDFIRQAEENEITVSEYIRKKQDKSSDREKRSINLKDLGYGEITLGGAFHQRTMITVKRPPGWNVGPGSYIELYFRHSALLNPERSSVTVYINGRPLKSVQLNGSNADKGVLKVEIPRDELNKSLWNIEFAFYHDIGMADCSKRYEEVAWSVIEENTRVVLTSGKNSAVSRWADFPNFNLAGDKVCSIILPENPGDEELTLAALLALRMGQVYGSNIKWKVGLGIEELDRNDKNLIVITCHKDVTRLAEKVKGIAFRQGGKNRFVSNDSYNIPGEYIKNGVICQVIDRKPTGIIYLISYPEESALKNLVSIFAEPEKMVKMQDELVLINVKGRIMNITASSDVSEGKNPFHLKSLQIPEDKVKLVYLILLGLAFIGTAVLAAVLWRKNR